MLYYLWADGEYQAVDEQDAPYSWKSDDYTMVEVPDDEEDDDEYLQRVHLEVNLGHSCEKRTVN